MDNVTLFERSDWYLFGCILTLFVSLFVAIFFTTQPSEKEGTLYFVGNDEEVCDGILNTEGIYSQRYTFKCSDGRILRNLTNFRIE